MTKEGRSFMTREYGLQDFVEETRAAISNQLTPDDVLRTLGSGFERLLRNRTFLRDEFGLPNAKAPVETKLYQDPDHDFVVLARIIKPKGSPSLTMPHDHGPLWALYGVYDNEQQLARYEPDESERTGPYPGLALVKDMRARIGEYDQIPPHNIHMPSNQTDQPSVILVVYRAPLASVVRRGYVPDIQGLVNFQGARPPMKEGARTVIPENVRSD
jgi:hypothetical protein